MKDTAPAETKISLGQLFREARMRLPEPRDMKDLAPLVSSDKDTLGNWERGKTAPNVIDALAYAKLLRIPLEDLATACGSSQDLGDSADIVNDVLAKTGWTPVVMAHRLGVESREVQAWRDGEARLPDAVARRLLLIVPISPVVGVASPLDDHAAPGTTSRDGARRRRRGES